MAYGEDADHVRQVLRLFSRPSARLITFAADVDGTDTAEITHEALFEHWEALQTWLARGRADSVCTAVWTKRPSIGRSRVTRWARSGARLTSIFLRAFHQRAGSDMTATQMAFFLASVRKHSARIGCDVLSLQV